MPSAAAPRSELWRIALPWCALGLAVRLSLLVLGGEPELHQDEANYVYLALGWERFGFLGDGERYLWPPLWTATLRACFHLFGREGLLAAKLLLVGSSSLIGAGVVGLSLRLVGRRAAHISGALWATYLPLAAYTHLLWAEPLFLCFLVPAIFALVEAEQQRETAALRWTFAAGLLLGGSLLVKETVVFLLPLFALGVWWSHRRAPGHEGLSRAALLLLSAAAVLAPWVARNAEVYGHFVPSGASLGANCFNGLNAHQLNFDVLPLERSERLAGRTPSSRSTFIAPANAAPWPTAAEVPNTVERSGVEVRRGLHWVRYNPGTFLLTRLKRLADFVLPTSYFVRPLGLRRSPGGVGSPLLGRAGSVLAMGEVVALLLLSIPGLLLLAQRRAPGTWILLLLAGYVCATSLLVSSSRFRVPLLPVLFVAAALALSTPHLWRALGRARLVAALGWALLLGLWWIDLPELKLVLEAAW